MKRKYFFFDIDGTLVAGGYAKDNYVPESAKLAIKKLEENGHFVALATGRSHAMAERYLDELGFKNMVSDGGYGMTIDGKLVDIIPLNHQYVEELIAQCDKVNFPWGLSVADTTYRLTPDERFYQQTHDTYMETRIEEGLTANSYPIIYKAYVACSQEQQHLIQPYLDKLPWARFHKEYIFIEPSFKAVGIKRMVDYLGGDYKDVVVFGDELNDLSMFIDEWTCIAMGNAREQLKQKATYVTTDVDKDGIYNACKHFGWID